MTRITRSAIALLALAGLLLFSGCFERFTQKKAGASHAGESAEEHAAHSEGGHEGESPEEHAAHSEGGHEGESAAEHAAHSDGDHTGETPEEHAGHSEGEDRSDDGGAAGEAGK